MMGYIYIYIWSPPARATHTCTTTANTDGRHVERNKLEEEKKEEPAAETDMHVLDLQLTLEQNGGERSAHGSIDL